MGFIGPIAVPTSIALTLDWLTPERVLTVVSVLIALLLLLAACRSATASVRSADASKQAASNAETSLRNSVRPVLVFVRRPNRDNSGDEKVWQLQNAGNGCAVDVLFGDEVDGKWKYTKCYPLAKDEYLVVKPGICQEQGEDGKAKGGRRLKALYRDIDQRWFVTECHEHLNTISQAAAPSDEELAGAQTEQDWPRKRWSP